MTITNGKITFSRTVRPADFEGKTAAVELSFTLPEGLDDGQISDRLDAIGQTARDKALALLGLQSAGSVIRTPTETIATGGAALPAEPEKPKTRGPNKPKDPPAPATPPAGEDIPGLGGATVEKTAGPTEAPSGGGDDLNDIMGLAAEPKEITDADLNAAVQKKNAVLQAPPKIRELIVKFQPDATKPPLLANVAQSRRQEFLTALEALTKD